MTTPTLRGVEVRLANVAARVWWALESAGLGQVWPPRDWAQPTAAPAVAQPCSVRAAHAASRRAK
jgi:hypothetical protein